MKPDLNEREIATLRRGLAARRKNVSRRKAAKPGEASSLAMELVSIDELDTKLCVVLANAMQHQNGDR